MGGCGCECGCCAVCFSGVCGGACYTCPPPTCGCGEDILSGETCINGNYFVVDSCTNQYYQFNFGYVILTDLNGTIWSSANDCVQMFIAYYYGLIDHNDLVASFSFPPGWYFTQTPPTDSTPANSGYGFAQNCFFWSTWYELGDLSDTFTSYSLVNCNSMFPPGEGPQYPTGSTPY